MRPVLPVLLLATLSLAAWQAAPSETRQARPQQPVPRATSSFTPTVEPPFEEVRERMLAERPGIEARMGELLRRRYDLADRPHPTATQSRGKPVQTGVRVRLHGGIGWPELARLSPEEVRERDLWPEGFLPLPHPHHEEGGMVFPEFHIERVLAQDNRDLTRFDMDFDLPDHLLPEFPPAIFLIHRADLGDASRGHLVTLDNFYELFDGILNPKQLDGLRLLVTPFPQQQFNATADRRSDRPSQGVACLDCHANGHTNAATHLVGDIRPQELRRRIDTPSLRGVNVQRLFGSQRALKTVEDFTEFEQRAAYFDGDPVMAAKKGINIVERASQVHAMGEFQAMLDFPPAPKLNVLGRLDRRRASESELRGEELFFGRAQCGACHPAPFYTDGLMHDLKVERFHRPRTDAGRLAAKDGPIKTFPLRGIKDSPPYLHDGRLLTLEDTVEFFNLVLELQLEPQEKQDLVSFMLSL